MAHHQETGNGNGTLNKLVFWILGIVATVFLTGICFFGARYVDRMEGLVSAATSSVHDLRDRVRELEVDVRRLREEMKQVQDEQRNLKRMIQSRP